MKKFGILMIAILLTASVCFTSCSLFAKDPEESEESETESVGSSETESESDSTGETESATDGNDESDTVEPIDPDKDAYADDIYTDIEPEEIL